LIPKKQKGEKTMLNSVNLIGYVGTEPEISRNSKGLVACRFRMVTTKTIKEKTKEAWHNITCFRDTAKNIGKYLRKGDLIHAKGEIHYFENENLDGEKRYYTGIDVEQILFLCTRSVTTKK
jgi:single-strand DNA-binding protein